MKNIFKLTISGVYRDRVFILISASIFLYLFVPIFSFLSMREIKETSITLSLTLNSFILLLLAILGGVSTIWRDIEKRHLYTLLSNPVSRVDYFLGRFFGFSFIMFVITLFNFLVALIVSFVSYKLAQDLQPPSFLNLFLAFIFSFFKFIMIMAFCFLFSAFSTSFFMPFFMTVIIFLIGNASQGIYDFVVLSSDVEYPQVFKLAIKIIHFLLPNLSSFDFTIFAAYGLTFSVKTIIFTLLYFIFYTTILLTLSLTIFNKKDLI